MHIGSEFRQILEFFLSFIMRFLASEFTSLALCFLTCKMRIIRVPNSKNCLKAR